MRINVLQDGDRVLNVTADFVAVERKNGEVDILPLIKEDAGIWIDTEHIITIGYGHNTVQSDDINGVTITNF